MTPAADIILPAVFANEPIIGYNSIIISGGTDAGRKEVFR